MTRLRLGTRGSRLALVQSNLIAARLRLCGVEVEQVLIVTEGDLRPKDSPIGEGVFTTDLERALLSGEIDLAVHSAKDMPLDEHPALTIAAYPERADPRDALVTRRGEASLADLRPGARVGTDSTRRSAFVRSVRPDLEVIPLLGNVDARVMRLDAGEADALVLAAAGLDRLGLGARAARLDPSLMPPAPAQGALAVQARRDDQPVLAELRPLDDPLIRLAVLAERAVLKAVGGGCRAPVGVLAHALDCDRVSMLAGAASPGGESKLVLECSLMADDARSLASAAGAVAAELRRSVPLRYRAVLETRTELDAAEASLLDELGFRVLHVPMVAIAPVEPRGNLDRARADLAAYDWVVLTSRRGVDALFDGIAGAPPPSVRWAAVGPTTAEALRERGVGVDALPDLAVGDAIPAAMAKRGPLRGARVLLARADAGAESLPKRLRQAGADVDEVIAYRSIPAPAESRQPLTEALADPGLEAVIFASGSGVRGLVELAGHAADKARSLNVFTIGPRTTAIAHDHGFAVTAEARTPDGDGLGSAVRRGLDEEVTRWVESQLATS